MEKLVLNNKTILVTGAAGFIGSNLVKRLFRDVKGATIIGIDNMNDYYDVSLKEYRLQELQEMVNTNLTNNTDKESVKANTNFTNDTNEKANTNLTNLTNIRAIRVIRVQVINGCLSREI